jgi:hypothetical protein
MGEERGVCVYVCVDYHRVCLCENTLPNATSQGNIIDVYECAWSIKMTR